ncbi:MAG: prolyl oligopeptidase family serine peptidase [Vulcanimicrobiaceae bacterium]|jgi:prolyl oligopeptidase
MARRVLPLLLVAATLIVITTFAGSAASYRWTYPAISRSSATNLYFGHATPNPYESLENVTSRATKNWVTQEERVTHEVLSSFHDRNATRALALRIGTAWQDGLPQVGGFSTVWSHHRPDKSDVLFVKTQSGTRVLLDPDRRWPDGKMSIGAWKLSPDGLKLGYSTPTDGAGIMHWHVMDIKSGRDLPDVATGVPDWYPIQWSANSRGFYYDSYSSDATRKAGTAIGQDLAVRFHPLGATADPCIYSLPSHPQWIPYSQPTADERYLFLAAESIGNLAAVIDLTEHDAPVRVVRPMSSSSYHFIDSSGSVLYFRTNHLAPNWKLVAIDLKKPAVERDVVPERSETLTSVDASSGFFITQYRRDAHSELAIFDRRGRHVRDVALPGVGVVDVSAEPATSNFYYQFSNLTTPPVTFQSDTRSGKSVVFSRVHAPFDVSRYITEEIFVRSKDGTRVPVFVAHRKNGRVAPTLITGYGNAGFPCYTRWYPIDALWLAKGGTFAAACIRGDGDYGEAWHRAGMLGKKQNSFDDFAAAAQALVARGFTTHRTLAAYGLSAGGLLVGVTEVQHPSLFHAVADEVGPVDVLRAYTYGTETSYSSEIGSPIASEQQFKWLRAYAPLLAIKQGTTYPATFVLTSENDARVSPVHAYKFTATMQWAQKANAPVVLYVVGGGHIGGTLSSEVAVLTDTVTFLWNETR